MAEFYSARGWEIPPLPWTNLSPPFSGDHWDFKREPHVKTGDLIKDIICLANSLRHTGDRYIIYGVDDTGSVVGLQSATHRTQADIVRTLSNAGFAGDVYPDIYLQQIELQGQRLEVLVIKDRPEKPYYLQIFRCLLTDCLPYPFRQTVETSGPGR